VRSLTASPRCSTASSAAPAVKTLSELDDRALRDIGINRSQIEDAVYGQFKAELTRYL
jgi:Domain of unknown function (DUF1127).